MEKDITLSRNIYELAYSEKIKYKAELENSLVCAIERTIREGTEKRKIELLGENAYIESLNYKKKIDKDGLKAFPKTLDYIFSKTMNFTVDKESELLKILIDKKQMSKETIIAIALIKDKFFSIEEYQKQIKKFDEEIKSYLN
jgi:hypothetical protein